MPTPPVAERKARGEDARAARREELLAAARRVFARQGFRGTTIADIAEEAGIALGTIYLYFPSKDDVFAALNEQLNELIAKALTDIEATGSLEEVVRARVNNVFAVCAENRDLVQLVVLNTDPESATVAAAATVRRGPDEAAGQGDRGSGSGGRDPAGRPLDHDEADDRRGEYGRVPGLCAGRRARLGEIPGRLRGYARRVLHANRAGDRVPAGDRVGKEQGMASIDRYAASDHADDKSTTRENLA